MSRQRYDDLVKLLSLTRSLTFFDLIYRSQANDNFSRSLQEENSLYQKTNNTRFNVRYVEAVPGSGHLKK